MQAAPYRIALIHATPLAVDPIAAAFQRHWPGARRMNLLDDSLSVDRAEAGGLTPSMARRFVDLAQYAKGTGCDALGLVATFEASIGSMAAELRLMASERGQRIELRTVFVPQAMQDLAEGRADLHHRKIADAARQLAGCDVVMLAQFSMADAQQLVQEQLACPVLSSPDCAVLALKKKVADA